MIARFSSIFFLFPFLPRRSLAKAGVFYLLPFALASFSFSSFAAPTPALTDLPLQDTVSFYGIHWKFSQQVRVGRFVNGDPYVVGNVTVSGITPAPTNGRNGSVLNVPPNSDISGFDLRVSSARFRESLRVYPPFSLKPGDALVSSISVDSMTQFKAWLREEDNAQSPVRSVSVLTCLAAPVPIDAFRPSYLDRSQKIFTASQIQWSKLPSVAKVTTVPNLQEWAGHYQRPWLDVCFFGFDAAVEYQPHYGREVGRASGITSLLLMLDYPQAQKEPLMHGFLQYGIDLWGMVTNGYTGWQAWGGHGSGRKWPIVFAGIMLGDSRMASPTKTYPVLQTGEDMHTMYGNGWTGAKVVYAGHQGVFGGKPVSTDPAWGPYEHLQPAQWLSQLNESYRRCCTSLAWVGQALAARMMGAVNMWSHPEFFDYVDRWMTEDDAAAVAAIKQQTGSDYSADWARQGQAWDAFVEQMWAKYRNNLPAIKTGKRPKAEPSPAKLAARGTAKSPMLDAVLPGSGTYELRVFDISGKQIFQLSQSIEQQGMTRFHLKTELQSGLYLVEVKHNQRILITQRLTWMS